MFQVLLAVHLIICLALIGAILLQRSEGGGALGIGGGGPGNLMSGRSASSLIVRTTQILGAAFFATSLGLTLLAANGQQPAGSVIEQGVDADGDGLPDRIDLGPSAPASGAATPAPAAPASEGGIPASAPTAPAPAAPAAPAPAEPAK